MLKRAALVLAILLPLAWLAASIFVASYEPTAAPDTALRLETSADGDLRWQLVHPQPAPAVEPTPVERFFGSGYTRSRGVMYDPDGPNEKAYQYLVARGALDAGRGTIPLAVGCVYRDWTRFSKARLEVTSDAAWMLDDAEWTVLATATPDHNGTWQSVALEGDAPADTVAVQLITVGPGENEETHSFSASFPRSKDWRERLREDLAALGIFRLLASED